MKPPLIYMCLFVNRRNNVVPKAPLSSFSNSHLTAKLARLVIPLVSFNRAGSTRNVVKQSPLVIYQSAYTSCPLTSFYLFSCSSYFCPVFPVFPRLIFCGKSKRRRVHCTLTVVVTPGATGCPPLVTLPPHLATIPTSSHPPQQPTFAPSRSPSSTFYPPFFLHINIPTYHTM